MQKLTRPAWSSKPDLLAWKPLIPFVIVNLLSAGVIGMLVVITTVSQDRIASNESIHLMGSVLTQMEQQLAQATQDFAYWDEAVDNLVLKVDVDWADTNIGRYLYDAYGVHSSQVFDQQNLLVYGALAGKRRLDDQTVQFSEGFQVLLNKARAGGAPGKKPILMTGYFRDADKVLFVAAAALTTYLPSGDDSTAKPTESVLILTKNIDAALLQKMADDYGVLDLRLEVEPANNATSRTSLALGFSNGPSAGRLTWQAKSPGKTMLRWLLPLVGGVFLLLAAIAAIFLHQTRKVVAVLNTEATKRDQITKELAEAHSSLELRIEERTEELRNSRQQFQGFAEAASDWLWELDADLRFTYVSPTIESRFGVTAASLIGRSITELSNKQFSGGGWRKFINFARKQLPIHNLEDRYVSPNGEEILLMSNCVPIFDEAGQFKGYRGATSDNTEQKRLEEALHQAQKMEAMGQLTGGIAHEFNNLLQVVAGNVGLLAENSADDPETAQCFQAIHRNVTRGAELTDRLLSFSRQQPLAPRAVEIGAVLSELQGMLSRTLGETIDIAIEAADDLWAAKADPGQLENALLNLVLNARDAMPGGGAITLSATNAKLDEQAAARREEATSGDYVLLSVTDNGSGMTDEALSHAFEPFFTTKDIGEGTGLGLSMVYGFAQQSGGFAEIESKADVGTTVDLYLPRLIGTGAEAAVRVAPLKTAAPGSGTILLVEDDADVRRSLAAQMTGLGYRVIEAEDGASALAVLDDETQIDLLFTDIMIPGGVSGLELARQLLLLRPELRVLYTTGYSEDHVAKAGQLEEDATVLRKPYDTAKLAAAISQILH